MWLRTKRFLKKFLFVFINAFFFIKKLRSKDNFPNILLIRLDSLGDYILFRNFIPELQKSSRFANHKLTLLGNEKWKEIAESLDNDYMDDFIWIDPKDLMNFKKCFHLLNNISKRKFRYIINPTISRSFYIDDLLIKSLDAKIKIGCSGDYFNISVTEKRKSDKFYDELIEIDNEKKFEFYRNKDFFEKLLQRKIELEKPFINLPDNFNDNLNENKYALIVPGAGNPNRQWSPDNFKYVINHLLLEYKLTIYITGSIQEKNLCDDLSKLHKTDKVFNLAGEISSIELLRLIKDSKIMISNETGPVHIAALLKTNAICISNGNTLFRFNPYPDEISTSIKYIYPETIKNNYNNPEKVEKYWDGSDLDMNEITKEEVIREIDNILKKTN